MNPRNPRTFEYLKNAGYFSAGIAVSYFYKRMQVSKAVQKGSQDLEQRASSVGQKFDSAIDKGRTEVAKAEDKIGTYRKETGQKIDEADRKIEENASKAKGEISSWFNGKRA